MGGWLSGATRQRGGGARCGHGGIATNEPPPPYNAHPNPNCVPPLSTHTHLACEHLVTQGVLEGLIVAVQGIERVAGHHDGALVRTPVYMLFGCKWQEWEGLARSLCVRIHTCLSATALAASSCPEAAVGKSAAKASVPGFGA